MLREMIMSGFGGQGALLIGQVLAIAGTVETLNAICQAVGIPVAAIGGLNKGNLSILENSPISGVSVVSAIMKQADPENAARELKEAVCALPSRRHLS